MENIVEKFYELKSSLIEIKNQLYRLEDKVDSIEGGYNLQKVGEYLVLAIGRLEYEFNVYNTNKVTMSEDSESEYKPYQIAISDIYIDLNDVINQNWDISENEIPLKFTRECIINSVIWIKEELKRLANNTSKIIIKKIK